MSNLDKNAFTAIIDWIRVSEKRGARFPVDTTLSDDSVIENLWNTEILSLNNQRIYDLSAEFDALQNLKHLNLSHNDLLNYQTRFHN